MRTLESLVKKVGGWKKFTSKIKPANKKELQKIIKDRIAKFGDECDLNDIDVSGITDMSELFYKKDGTLNKFNGDLSSWDVSNVKDFYRMFCGCDYFNCDISGWNTSSAENMKQMFARCLSFDQDLSKWDVKNVRDFSIMFYNTNIDCDLSSWDPYIVDDCRSMFTPPDDCRAFGRKCGMQKKHMPEFFLKVFGHLY